MTERLRQEYKVRGRWPFPVDMLRRDDAQAATEADSNLIRAFSQEHCPEGHGMGVVEIKLVRHQDHKWQTPNFERWKSFQWAVVPESLPEHLRPMPPERERKCANIQSVTTVTEAEERVSLIAYRVERDPEAATMMERDFHRDVLYSIAHGLTEQSQEIAKIAFETWRMEFLRC